MRYRRTSRDFSSGVSVPLQLAEPCEIGRLEESREPSAFFAYETRKSETTTTMHRRPDPGILLKFHTRPPLSRREDRFSNRPLRPHTYAGLYTRCIYTRGSALCDGCIRLNRTVETDRESNFTCKFVSGRYTYTRMCVRACTHARVYTEYIRSRRAVDPESLRWSKSYHPEIYGMNAARDGIRRDPSSRASGPGSTVWDS